MKNLIIIIVILFFNSILFADGVQPTGNGTEADPYLVETLDNLLWISTNWWDQWDKHFIQTADIDATDTINWNEGEGFSPIGTSVYHPFTGTYNGQDHIIDGLFINRPTSDNQGLFGYTWEGSIEDLGVTNVDITGQNEIGGLMGFNYNTNPINCYSTGIVNGSGTNTGGLVGENCSNIVNCYSLCSVSGNDQVGGLIGYNQQTPFIRNCYSSGDVSGFSNVGGLVGVNSVSTISECYSSGSVSGTGSIGGLIGCSGSGSIVCNCYSSATIYASLQYIGGMIGFASYSTVNNCYSIGYVSGTENGIGGFLGHNTHSDISNSFWDVETSGIDIGSGGGYYTVVTGKTTAEMKNAATFTDTSTVGLEEPWDFVGNPNNDNANEDYWNIDGTTNSGYPFLSLEESVHPAAPTDIIITIVGDDIELSWDDMSATIYKIYRSTEPYSEDWGEEIGYTFINSYTNIGAASETQYFYYVTSLD